MTVTSQSKQIARALSAIILIRIVSAGTVETTSAAPEPRFKIYGWIETGATFNPDRPGDHQNFGRLFDDRANELLLNQVALTFERTVPSATANFDWGFKLQAMVGSDARFIHSLGLFDNTVHETVEPDLAEAFVVLHLPVLGASSVDLKLGKFVTLEGAETIDPGSNPFYSHTYIFNFGIPFNHTGALATWHATPQLDLYAGLTRGVNASIDDNNDSFALHGGVGLNLLEGKLTALASTHLGPETTNDNRHNRYLNDLTITAKPAKQLTLITDLNYIYDAAANVEGYGIAQYFVYTINDAVSLGVRGELWRDADGFYVASFAENDDASDALRGGAVSLDPRTVGGGKTTYGAVTVGFNIRPPVPKPAATLQIRPELRFDRALSGARPFDDSSDRNQFTAGIDCILAF